MKYRKWRKSIHWWCKSDTGQRFTKANAVYLYRVIEIDGKKMWTYTARPKAQGANRYGVQVALFDGRRVQE